jgi:hypothetical protein
MLISNVKSNADLVGKKKLQADLIELSVANESELEKRVKDYKNPNKPVPVAPEYKSNAELQKDRLAQERQAIANMEEFGFDYNKSADIVAWLSSSIINRLVEFNANFKGIKKELLEKTNPKLLTTDYLKNYLENYFEDMDVNFGRKFGKRETDGITQPTTIDDLSIMMPDAPLLDEMMDVIAVRHQEVRETISNINTTLRVLRRNVMELQTAETQFTGDEKKAMSSSLANQLKNVKAFENEVEIRVGILRGFENLRDLFNLYSVVLPSSQMIATMKQSLTQQERSDLVRRYVSLLRKIKILTRGEVQELLNELKMAGEDTDFTNFIRKANRGLSFLNDKAIDEINKLQKNYENLIENSSEVADAGNIKRLNEIRTEEIKLAKEAVLKGLKLTGEETALIFEGDVYPLKQSNDPKGISTRNEIVANIELEAGIRNDRDLEIKQQEGRRKLKNGQLTFQQASDLQLTQPELDRAQMIDMRRTAELGGLKDAPPLITRTSEKRKPIEPKSGREVFVNTDLEYIPMYNFYHQKTIEELDEIFKKNQDVGIKTARNYLNEFGWRPNELRRIKGQSNEEVFDNLKDKIRDASQRKLQNILRRNMAGDYDYAEKSIKVNIGQSNKKTKYGIGTKGLPKKIIKHLREDDAENKALSKAFKKHMKIEKEVNGDSSDEEKGGALKFKHKKIKVGKGISVEAQPAYKTFGKYVIHMGHLIDKNVANFKYPSLGSIPAIKPLTVSDDYKDFIMDTLENGKPNDRIFSKLPQEEQKHFERVVLGAGLLDAFKLRRTKSDSEKKDADRFNILRGEVMAGNNSEKVIKELRGLIIRFMNEGRIQQKEGTGMLVELSAI